MLPSQGLFRSIPCPFFIAGLCDRPHCSYRHCRTDIRIDRKLEADILDDPLVEEEEKKTSSASQSEEGGSGGQGQSSVKDAGELKKLSSDIIGQNKITNSAVETVTNKSATINSERLINSDQTPVISRKRSCEDKDSEGQSSRSKRPKTNEDGKEGGGSESEEMGQVLSTTGSIVRATGEVLKSCLPGSQKKPEELEDIDEIVRRIEGTDKPIPRRHTHHEKHKKKHKHHRRRDSETSSSAGISSPDKDKRDGQSSQRKGKNDGTQNKERGKERDRKDSRKDKYAKKDEHSRRKESSSSGSSSRKDPRKSSSFTESRSAVSKKDDKKKEDLVDSSRSSSSLISKERRPSGSSSGKGSSESFRDLNQTLASTLSVDVSNRFNVLAENSADESAYNSDMGEDLPESFSYDVDRVMDSEEEDAEMVEMQCFQFFESYKAEEEPKQSVQRVLAEAEKKEDGDGLHVIGKKRVAHVNAVSKPPGVASSSVPEKKIAPAPATRKNLQDTLVKRFEHQSTSRINASSNGTRISAAASHVTTITAPPVQPKGKCRIAHVPNAGLLAKKPTISQSTTKSVSSGGQTSAGATSVTYSQTATKGVPRQAHKPSSNIVAKQGPIVFRDAINKSSKIPHVTRQLILDKMYAEYVRIEGDATKAFEMTVKREDELVGKCTSKQVYYSSGISIISGLRKRMKESGGSTNSHEQILYGSLAAKNCSVLGSRSQAAFPEGNALYKALLRYLLTEEELRENGYPRKHPSGLHGRIVAKPRPGEENSMTLTHRICDRCHKRYQTTEQGDHLHPEVCNYHWGRKFNQISKGGRGSRETSWNCCSSDDDRIGCVTAVCHVSKNPIPLDSQKGFVYAVYSPGDPDKMGEDEWDIIGIDCEMVYTTRGTELARVTVVNINRKVLYDVVVKPTRRVLDCNTRFSGLTFNDIDAATKTITDVQAILLTHLRPNTILIGHSLESDLIALKIRHDYVIDTAILYPHRMGPPKKRALRTLSAEILFKVIQAGDHGHDSAEDAQIAVELVLAKLKSDLASK